MLSVHPSELSCKAATQQEFVSGAKTLGSTNPIVLGVEAFWLQSLLECLRRHVGDHIHSNDKQ